MAVDRMLRGATVLLAFQLAGEGLAHLVPSVPGPVFGLVGLFIVLVIAERRGHREPAGVGVAADAVLARLPLLFVPAGVGIIGYGHLIADAWATLAVTVIGVTLAGIGLTAAIAGRWMRAHPDAPGPAPAPLPRPEQP